jgi:hypothetical protein
MGTTPHSGYWCWYDNGSGQSTDSKNQLAQSRLAGDGHERRVQSSTAVSSGGSQGTSEQILVACAKDLRKGLGRPI